MAEHRTPVFDSALWPALGEFGPGVGKGLSSRTTRFDLLQQRKRRPSGLRTEKTIDPAMSCSRDLLIVLVDHAPATEIKHRFRRDS